MRKLSMDELNRLSKEDFQQAEKLPIIIVLDNIRSLSNVGAFFRTADAFRIGELFLCGITACPPHREIHKPPWVPTKPLSGAILIPQKPPAKH